MDGLSVIDKPSGPTSHDVVNRMRRVLGERRVGHAGTLDPGATGVLVLLVGRATRLAQFLNGSDKVYEAVIRLGLCTDTGDAEGTPLGAAYDGPIPRAPEVERALDGFRGRFLQRPPAFSAKHVAGTRSHRIARSARRTGTAVAEETLPQPVPVTAHRIDLLGVDGADVTVGIQCSAGFYVRSLAQDLGERLGTGGHVKTLRRTRSGDFGLEHAISLAEAENKPAEALRSMLPMADALPALPAVMLTAEGARHVLHGRDVGPAETGRPGLAGRAGYVRLIDGEGRLVAIAGPARTPGLLHPLVVLV